MFEEIKENYPAWFRVQGMTSMDAIARCIVNLSEENILLRREINALRTAIRMEGNCNAEILEQE